MRTCAVSVLLLLVLAGPLCAIEGGVDAGLGLTYEFGDNIVPEDPGDLVGIFSSLLNVLTALRVGGNVCGRLDIVGPISAGAELGAYCFPGSDGEGNAAFTPLVDLPVRAFARVTLRSVFIQGHVGYNFATYIDLESDSALGVAHKLDLGVRAGLGAFYVQVDKLFWAESKRSTRAGAGILFLNLIGP
jgi:hypothetical protein